MVVRQLAGHAAEPAGGLGRGERGVEQGAQEGEDEAAFERVGEVLQRDVEGDRKSVGRGVDGRGEEDEEEAWGMSRGRKGVQEAGGDSRSTSVLFRSSSAEDPMDTVLPTPFSQITYWGQSSRGGGCNAHTAVL